MKISGQSLLCSIFDGIPTIEMRVDTGINPHHYVGKLITAIVTSTEIRDQIINISAKYGRDVFPIVEAYETEDGEQAKEIEKDNNSEQSDQSEEDEERSEEEQAVSESFERLANPEQFDEGSESESEEGEEEEEEPPAKKKPGPPPGIPPPGFNIRYDKSGRISTVFIKLNSETVTRKSIKKAYQYVSDNPNYLDQV